MGFVVLSSLGFRVWGLGFSKEWRNGFCGSS